MADPTTPAEREARALHVAHMLDNEECCQAVAGMDVFPVRCTNCTRDAADMVRRLLSDLAAAEAQIAEARREGMMEAAGIALDATKAPSQRNMKDQWRAAIGEEVGAVIRAAASGGRDGER